MCPNNNTSSGNHSNSRRNNQFSPHRLETPPSNRSRDVVGVVDDPPPVLNCAATSLRVRHQTPQHLATLVAPISCSGLAGALVLENKYFVWGLAEGKIGVWTNEQFATSGTLASTSIFSPAVILDTNASTQWVQISHYKSQEKDQLGLEILCLTSGGVFFHIQFHQTPSLKLEILKTWHTKRAGTACFGVTKSHCIVIGYNNGNVEAWRKERRIWLGHFEAFPGIRSIVSIDTSSRREYVLLTLDPKDHTTTNCALEVICLTAIEENKEVDRTQPVSLEDYWVLAQAGREVVNATILSDTYCRETSQRFALHWIPSHGTQVATNLPGTGGQIMVEIADGSVVFLDATSGDSARLEWGINPNGGQFLLSFPSVGRGVVTIDGQAFAACALRGGTVYLFPLSTESSSTSANDGEIRSMHYPDDISRDSSVQQLQHFVAADVELPAIGEGTSSLPLLFFCWPGGITDVYCAHLLPSVDGSFEELAPLFENGSVDDLYRLLRCLQSNDPDRLLADPLWKRALDEILATPNENKLTTKDFESIRYVSFQRLLRQLGDLNTQEPIG
eukprot:scaffold1569_cov171-Amphora_coffeaeformis.AAC.25